MSSLVISTGRQHFEGEISQSLLGAELLGWEPTKKFEATLDALEYDHLRWPGGIPAEDGIDINGDGIRDRVFSLTDPELLSWRRWIDDQDKSDGIPEGELRPGLSYILNTLERDLSSVSVVLPTAQYAKEHLQNSDIDQLKQRIAADVKVFTDSLKEKIEERVLTNKTIILELGSEYYATDVWRLYNDAKYDDPEGGRHAGDVLDAFSNVFALMAGSLQNELGDNWEGTKIVIAAQSGRIQSSADSGNYDGQPSDSDSFISAFHRHGSMEALDGLIWHRYVNEFELTNHGFTAPFSAGFVKDEISKWEHHRGESLKKVIGWLSPDVQHSGIKEFGPIGDMNILNLFSNLVRTGFDYGSLFGTNVGRSGTLAEGDDLYSGGELYANMIGSLIGLGASKFNNANESPFIAAGEENVFVFRDSENLELFYKKNGEASENDTLQFTFDDEFRFVSATVYKYEGQRLTGEQLGVVPSVSAQVEVDGIVDNGYTMVTIPNVHQGDLVRLSLGSEAGGSGQMTHIRDTEERALISDSWTAVRSSPDQFASVGKLSDIKLEQRTALTGEGGGSLRFSDGVDDLFFTTDSASQTLIGNDQGNIIAAGAGDDNITCGAGVDLVFAGAGNDTINCGAGENHISTGPGDDLILLACLDSVNTIYDFTPNADRISIPERDSLHDYSQFSLNVMVAGEFSYDDIFFGMG